MIPLQGWTPDFDPDYAGGMTDCLDIIPSDRGIKPRPTPAATNLDALAAACRGIVSAKRTDGGITTLAGTASNLYKLAGTAWSSIDTATLGAEERWEFDQWGNYTMIATPFQTITYFDGTTLTSIAQTVKAAHIVTVNGFVMAANYADGSDTNTDGWICSAYQDATDWANSPATQSAKGRLLDSPGAITALCRLGASAVAFQERAVYVGVYVGSPAVWGFQKVPGEVGVLSRGLVVSNEQFLLFFGSDDVYRFDGTNCIPLQAAVSRRVIDTMNRDAAYCCQSTWDDERGLAWWFYPTENNTVADSYVCFHPETGRWGYGLIDVEAVVQLITGGYTYDSLPDWTYDTIPSYPYDSTFWTGDGKPTLTIVSDDHTVYTLNGNAGSSSMTLSEIGSDQQYSLMSQFFPRFFDQPTSATATIHAKYDADTDWQLVTTTGIYKGRFDFLTTALWHRIKIDLTGQYEMQGFDAVTSADGLP